MSIRVAILGFGTVGQGVYETLRSHRAHMSNLLGEELEVVGILIQDGSKEREIDASTLVTTNYEKLLQLQVDVVIEAIVGQQPAYHYLVQAIKSGAHVVTANKVMFAHYGQSLLNLAAQHNVQVGYEATTAGGTPIIRTLQHLLKVNQVSKLEAILNGTSNYMLTEMAVHHLSFEEALQQAQQKGYAELDPSNDINGDDAFYKAMILSRLAFGMQPNWNDVYKEGIERITLADIQQEAKRGRAIKHVATIEIREDIPRVSVQPVFLDESHPLYRVDGVNNAITIHTDLLDNITITGPGAGKLPTASAIVEDLVHCFKQQHVVPTMV
ncbi:homoserine dehydrogenase [Pontibacillus litoralis]|uniref:homoserine dehydrogenase n=1 Tax=Pontibacillus litoralis TaxID=516703 RepID=UPI00056CAEF6|nr:homoserine dehydrogenase [Pontibacillus litoralis]